MKRFIFVFFFSTLFINAYSQEQQEEAKNFGIRFSGFIKNDFFYDTRQTTCAREGHFLLWPSAVNEDANGEDINAKSSFNFLALQSRLTGKITGPDALGAKTSGVIEGDFFAQANDNINLFRLRHAFIKLNWKNTELLTGQYWNPVFVPECFPGTVSFNTGTPIQGFARNPQIRLTHALGKVKLMAAALAQRDYASYGPKGASSEYLRNSVVPDLHLQAQVNLDMVIMGAGISYKEIVPRLSSTQGNREYKVEERVGGFGALAYAKLTTKPLTFKVYGRYGENNTDQLTISGFAAKSVVNAETGEMSYTPMRNTSGWLEVHTNGSKFQAGLFAGITKNLGTKEEMSSDFANNKVVYGFGHTIESLYRISPRALVNINKIRFALETEYTVANYGAGHDLNWKPQTTSQVANFRALFSVYYFF